MVHMVTVRLSRRHRHDQNDRVFERLTAGTRAAWQRQSLVVEVISGLRKAREWQTLVQREPACFALHRR
jgi:hypothetical protein